MKSTGIFLFSVLFIFMGISSKASDLVNYYALNSKIIVLHFDDGYVRYHKKGESRTNEWVVHEPLNLLNAANLDNFEITSENGHYSTPQNPVKIERKTKGTEFTWLCSSWSQATGCINSQPDHAKEHWIYLYLPDPLTPGEKYMVSTKDIAGNGKNWEFVFDIETNRSEAVHVNLVGYDTRAPKKYGYVYHWGGGAGSIDFSNYSGSNFYLVDTKSGERVFTGELAFRKSKSNDETKQPNDTPDQNFLGADVWECDFSKYNTPGEYILAVEGIGHSFPFQIKRDALRHAYYNSIRGLFHNRSGIALEEPYTEFTRPAPHNPLVTPGFAGKLYYTTSRFIDWNNLDNSSADLKAIEYGILGPINTFGWYQDAGDWDGYFSHLKIPALLMLTWEIAPENFGDGELNIPEGENGIPDIVDEARWLIRFFYRTRHEIMDRGYGSGGVGSRVAPDWFGHAEHGTPSYEDTGKWVISGEDPFTTYFYAGLAGHFAVILNKLGIEDPEGIDWEKESLEAYNWALANTLPKDTDPGQSHDFNLADFQLYAATSLFRLTGKEIYADAIEKTGSSINYTTVLNEDKKWGVYSLAINTEHTFPDETFLTKIKHAVIATADDKNSSVYQRACRWGGNIWLPMVIGQGTTPRVFEMMMGHVVSKEVAPAKTNTYFTNLFTTADYFLGCNPLNMTWITHVGIRYPERVFHMDSWYNGKDEMAPGIIPYGPWRDQKSAQTGPWDVQWPYKTLYPDGIDNWPGHERWFNNYTTPANAEFTVHQNTVLSAVVYGYLCDQYDGSYEANLHPQTQLSLDVDSVVWQKEIELTATASDPNGDGDIAWVEFYNDWHKIGQSNQPPFTIKWKNPKYGSAKISTKVVDKNGYSAKSDVKVLHVTPGKHNVVFLIKDSITGNQIKGAAITIEEQLQTTAENGQAAFTDVYGIFSFTAKHDNYQPLEINDLEIYSDTTLVFDLAPVVKNISVVLHDALTGEVFRGTSVGFNLETGVTNENGEVNFQVFVGEYTYLIDKNSYKTETGTVTVESDTTFHFHLVRTEAELKIQLIMENTPVNNARVIVNNDTLYSSALGITRFKNLPVNQEFQYQIYKDGFQLVTDTLYLTTDTVVVVSMQKIPTATGQLNGIGDLKIWPNPVSNELTVSASSPINLVEVFSVTGVQTKVLKPEKSNRFNINLSQLTPGTYFVKFFFANGSLSVRSIEKF